jgi:hypothetical protein
VVGAINLFGVIALGVVNVALLCYMAVVCRVLEIKLKGGLLLRFLLSFGILAIWQVCMAAYLFGFRHLGPGGVIALPFARQIILIIVRKVIFEITRVFPVYPAVMMCGLWPQNISDMVCTPLP